MVNKSKNISELRITKPIKDDIVIDYFDSQLATGMRRTDAILSTCKKFGIKHPQTVYNTEKRVRIKRWEVKYGKREA